MKVIIPMAGKGLRFSYEKFFRPKPLIEIDGKSLIEYVVGMFSKDCEFIFLCNEDHLKTTNMENILKSLVPDCKIISINKSYLEGKLKGPVVTATAAFDLIKDDEEVIVNYCDFITEWNFADFLDKIRSIKCDGAVVSFNGFHPASLGETYYAYMKVDNDNYVTNIQEKKPYSKNRMDDFASTGTYYFSKGKHFKDYCNKTIDQKLHTKGEIYATLPYILMIKDGMKIFNYSVPKFICLGTPRDYEQYKFWSEFFFLQSWHSGFNNVALPTTNIFPIAGGERDFKEIGSNELNFMIPLMNSPLITNTIESYPIGDKNIFIALKENKNEIGDVLNAHNHNTEILYLDEKKSGNAMTILEAEKLVDSGSPVCVSGCHYLLTYDRRRLLHLFEDPSVDVILLSFTHQENVLRNPKKYAYAKIKDGRVLYIKEKETISDDPYKDHAMTGTVIFKKASDLFSSIKKMVEKSKDEKTFYFITAINELINQGKHVSIFEVDKFISLANVVDYQEFLYWQSFFNNLVTHPYSKVIK